MPNQEIIKRNAFIPRHPIRFITGTALLMGGIVSIAFWGVGFFSILNLLAGILFLLGAKPFRRLSAIDVAHQIETQDQEKLKELKRYISKTQYLENVGNLGEKAANQLSQICERYDSFQKILPLKFSPNEITYSRYHTAVKQTFLSILDNLNLAATTLNHINSLDIQSIEERKLLREQQVQKLNELFSLNDKAITEFDRLSTALSEIQTRKGESSTGLEASIAELTELANRAKKYNVSS